MNCIQLLLAFRPQQAATGSESVADVEHYYQVPGTGTEWYHAYYVHSYGRVSFLDIYYGLCQ